jgi:hypothetical protein
MAYYYSLRGWIEVEPEHFNRVVEAITRLRRLQPTETKEGLYLKGWTWSDAPVNWTGYVFYGADVTAEGLLWLRATLQELARLGLHLSGFFHAQGEDGGQNARYPDDR